MLFWGSFVNGLRRKNLELFVNISNITSMLGKYSRFSVVEKSSLLIKF